MNRTERVTNDVRIRVGETRSLKNVTRRRRWDRTETIFYGRDEESYHSRIKCKGENHRERREIRTLKIRIWNKHSDGYAWLKRFSGDGKKWKTISCKQIRYRRKKHPQRGFSDLSNIKFWTRRKTENNTKTSFNARKNKINVWDGKRSKLIAIKYVSPP